MIYYTNAQMTKQKGQFSLVVSNPNTILQLEIHPYSKHMLRFSSPSLL